MWKLSTIIGNAMNRYWWMVIGLWLVWSTMNEWDLRPAVIFECIINNYMNKKFNIFGEETKISAFFLPTSNLTKDNWYKHKLPE